MVKTKENSDFDRMRLDKWLKIARLFKTRSQAISSCQSRHVKVNGKTAKPSRMIKIEDTISIQYPNRNRSFDVVGLAQRSLPAAAARELYIEHLPKISVRNSARTLRSGFLITSSSLVSSGYSKIGLSGSVDS